MRWLATSLLAAMAGLLLLSRHTGAAGPWLRAFAEAALVGGLADWFAVTALFRRPLGLPIPHTAIIPANRDRIADAMAVFLRAHFLIPAVVGRRLAGFDFASAMARVLADPMLSGRGGEAARLRRGAASLLGDVVAALDDAHLGALLRSALRQRLEALDLAPLLGALLSGAIARGRHRQALDAGLLWLGHALEANEALLRGLIAGQADHVLLRLTGLDGKLAEAILDGLCKLVAEAAVDHDHPLRARAEAALEDFARALREDPAMRARVATAKAEVLASPAMAAWLEALWAEARAALLRMAEAPEEALSGGFAAGLAGVAAVLRAEPRLRGVVNRLARRTLAGVTGRYGEGIVTLVSATVKRWDARTVSARVEGAVGRDLQFIRINGTLVGGLVGLGLHALMALR